MEQLGKLLAYQASWVLEGDSNPHSRNLNPTPNHLAIQKHVTGVEPVTLRQHA